MEIAVSMCADEFKRFADQIREEIVFGGGGAVELECLPNGDGPKLRISFDNDDMEDRDDLHESTVLWTRIR